MNIVSSTQEATPKTIRDPRLDILRAIAVLLVLGRHVEFFRLWSQAGWIGVDLFFVISGFLISGLLFSEFRTYGEIRIGRFYGRRALKIYPPFYLLIAVTVAMDIFLDGSVNSRKLLPEIFFVQNYWDGLWPHTWSLAVEEHFYFLLPILLYFLGRRKPLSRDAFSALPWIYCGVAILLLGLRYETADTGYRHYLYPTHLRLDSLLLGVILSYYHFFRREVFLRVASWPFLAPLSLCLIAPAVIFPVENHLLHSVGLTSLSLGFSGLLMVFLAQVPVDLLKFKGVGTISAGLAAIGRHSYSIYLWHMPVIAWGMPILNRITKINPSLHRIYQHTYFFAYLALSIAAGIILSKLIEIPVLAWRDRHLPSRSSDATQVPRPSLAKGAAVGAIDTGN